MEELTGSSDMPTISISRLATKFLFLDYRANNPVAQSGK